MKAKRGGEETEKKRELTHSRVCDRVRMALKFWRALSPEAWGATHTVEIKAGGYKSRSSSTRCDPTPASVGRG